MPGADVHGFFRFQTNTPPLFPGNPYVGNYAGAVDVASITIGNWSLARSIFVPDPTQTVSDLIVTDRLTSEGLGAEQSSIDMLDPTGTFTFSSILALELSTRQPDVFDTTAMLTNPPDLSKLDPFGFDPDSAFGYGTDVALYAENGPGGTATTFRASLTSLMRLAFTPQLAVELPGGIGNVPEPAGGILMALAALASLVATRRC
ncbi:MAG TPA: hypothetical protein VMR31_01240 [Myxococcota bacterium]|nr:hypothetical protein [Myxococcota bacterium]